MKLKRLLTALSLCALCALTCAVTACAKKTDYNLYVSEKRTSVYLYEDDDVSLKIYCSQKEQPYAADGYKGNVCDLTEIFVKFNRTAEKVEINAEGIGGEMNYSAVDKNYYLSFSSPDFESDRVQVTLTVDGTEKTYNAQSVKDERVLSCDDALKCVIEHEPELFANLTANGLFDGEIFIRLIYDEGCYYYVGICDKQGDITAFLVDGERGKIIAKKQLHN